jgi:hypothetical protein
VMADMVVGAVLLYAAVRLVFAAYKRA